MTGNLSINMGPLLRFIQNAESAVDSGLNNPDLRDGFENAQRSYLAFAADRFAQEGNGSWRDLAETTQAERRYLGFAPAHPILHRLGLLEGALTPGAPGNLFETSANSVRAGYGGDFEHPGYLTPEGGITGGGIRLADIAAFHNSGGARPIIVPPPQQTLEVMRSDVTHGFQQMITRAAADTKM